MPGASLTSTSVDPQTTSSKLVWDEVRINYPFKIYAALIYAIVFKEELMFEAISNPLKGKGKEKDVGKRRAYVRVVTSLGGASLNLELFCEKVSIMIDTFDYSLTNSCAVGAKDVLQLPHVGSAGQV